MYMRVNINVNLCVFIPVLAFVCLWLSKDPPGEESTCLRTAFDHPPVPAAAAKDTRVITNLQLIKPKPWSPGVESDHANYIYDWLLSCHEPGALHLRFSCLEEKQIRRGRMDIV